MFACVASPNILVVIVIVVVVVIDRGDDGDWIIGFAERCGYGRGSLDSFSSYQILSLLLAKLLR